MRIMFLFFSVFVFLFRLTAQDSSTVRVFSRYSFGVAPVATADPYFIARSVQPLQAAEADQLVRTTTRAVSRQVLNGAAVFDYTNAYMLEPGFPAWFAINEADKLTPEDLCNNPLRLHGAYVRGDDPSVARFSALQDARVAASRCTLEMNGQIITRSDTVFVPGKKRDQLIKRPVVKHLDPANTSVFFGENWLFDYRTGVFKKEVLFTGFGEVTCPESETGWSCYTRPLYTISPMPDTITRNEKLFRRNQVTDVALDYAASAMSYRYQGQGPDVQDIPGLLGIADGTIAHNYRMPFLGALFSYAIKHPEAVFAVTGEGAYDSLQPLKTSMAVRETFVRWDTVQVENPNNPGEYTEAVLKYDYPLSDVYAIRFYEDWYINEQTGYIRKKVHGISFLLKADDYIGVPYLRNAGIYLKTQ